MCIYKPDQNCARNELWELGFGKTHTFVHKVNGGERWSVRKLTFVTYYSKIMEKIIKNLLNCIQNVCIIHKRIICYSQKPHKSDFYMTVIF